LYRLGRPDCCPAEPHSPEQTPARRYRRRLHFVAESIEIDTGDRNPTIAEP